MATPLYDENVAVYRYFTADILSNSVIAEIPLKSVSYERAIKGAGDFSGKIPVIDGNAALNLYESTMPGKTAIYVVRNNVCVWGGIIWSRSYNAKQRVMTINGSEWTSYFYHRNIWKTYTHDFEVTVVVTSGVAQVTIENGNYEVPVGSSIRLIFYEVGNFVYNGYYVVAASPAPTDTVFYVSAPSIPNGTYTLTTLYVRSDAYDYMRQLIDSALVDFTNIEFPNDEIEPATATRYTVTNKQLSSNVVTLTTSTAHNLIIGQTVQVENVDSTLDGTYEVSSIPTSTSFTYDLTGTNIASTAVSNVTLSVTNKAYTAGIATLTTSASHGLAVGNVVTVAGVDSTSANEITFNGMYSVASVPTATTFTYSTYALNKIASVAASGTATIVRAAVSSTYGEFPANADIGLDYSDLGYADKNLENATYRGYLLKSVGEELDEYSDSIDGFEYRVDCDYDPTTGSFTRTLVFIPINFPNPPAPGEVSPISRFGADQLVFEFPGNINDIDVKESSENAATRFFVVGNIPDLGDDISQPYAAASATDLLAAGWPLLDQEEEKQDISDEQILYDHAARYLNEFRPPVADITISVNGSLNPVVGTYFPGDWCSIIANDEFIRQRLSSDLEVRDTVLVRKIDSIKVSVPDTPSFPEQVSLELVTEWEVDRRGE
jgi:hypothetical protein